jgi:hypothetical protein
MTSGRGTMAGDMGSLISKAIVLAADPYAGLRVARTAAAFAVRGGVVRRQRRRLAQSISADRNVRAGRSNGNAGLSTRRGEDLTICAPTSPRFILAGSPLQ